MIGLTTFALVLIMALFHASALAVHNTGVFELDGNAIVNVPPRDGWNMLFAGPGTSFAHVFLDDHALPGAKPGRTTAARRRSGEPGRGGRRPSGSLTSHPSGRIGVVRPSVRPGEEIHLALGTKSD